jgi:hypothetical protein
MPRWPWIWTPYLQPRDIGNFSTAQPHVAVHIGHESPGADDILIVDDLNLPLRHILWNVDP